MKTMLHMLAAGLIALVPMALGACSVGVYRSPNAYYYEPYGDGYYSRYLIEPRHTTVFLRGDRDRDDFRRDGDRGYAHDR